MLYINKDIYKKKHTHTHTAVKQYNTEDLVHDCFSCVTAACNTAFRISKRRKLKTKRTVPWWNDELKILRKKSTPYDDDIKEH